MNDYELFRKVYSKNAEIIFVIFIPLMWGET